MPGIGCSGSRSLRRHQRLVLELLLPQDQDPSHPSVACLVTLPEADPQETSPSSLFFNLLPPQHTDINTWKQSLMLLLITDPKRQANGRFSETSRYLHRLWLCFNLLRDWLTTVVGRSRRKASLGHYLVHQSWLCGVIQNYPASPCRLHLCPKIAVHSTKIITWFNALRPFILVTWLWLLTWAF